MDVSFPKSISQSFEPGLSPRESEVKLRQALVDKATQQQFLAWRDAHFEFSNKSPLISTITHLIFKTSAVEAADSPTLATLALARAARQLLRSMGELISGKRSWYTQIEETKAIPPQVDDIQDLILYHEIGLISDTQFAEWLKANPVLLP